MEFCVKEEEEYSYAELERFFGCRRYMHSTLLHTNAVLPSHSKMKVLPRISYNDIKTQKTSTLHLILGFLPPILLELGGGIVLSILPSVPSSKGSRGTMRRHHVTTY